MLIAAVLSGFAMKRNNIKVYWTAQIGITAFVTAFLLFRFGVSLITAKGVLLCLVLLYASFDDIKYRKADDCIWIMIAMLGLINAHDIDLMLIGSLTAFGLLLIISFIRPLGGADIKIMTALAFLLGIYGGLAMLLSANAIAVIFMAFYSKKKKISIKTTSFSMVPFIGIGAMLVFLIS